MGRKDDGFEGFYRAQYASLRRLAYRLTADWAAADDLTQETMMRTYRAWRRIHDRQRPDMYARSVLLNRHRTLVRRSILHRERVRPAPEHVEGPSEERAVIWAELARLPIRERQAVVLHYYEDMPQTEIARVMEVAQGTVNSLVYRGLRRLRERLGAGDEPVRSQA